MPNQDFVRNFAEFVSSCRYEDLPPEAVEAAKKSILDLLGVSLAAAGTVPAVATVIDLVRESGGKPESTVLGFGGKVPSVMAALANGAMAHCLDFDDVAPDGNHASSTLIPTVFAAAEHQGGISGKDLITAVAIGQDLFLRMRRSLQQRMDWLVTTVLGVFSATAGAAYVLSLDTDQVAHALGIASLGSCGTLELRFGTNSDLGELYAGFIAKSALLSALLAKRGVTGTQKVFEGQAGIMRVYFDDEYDRTKILEGLGTIFGGSTMQYKPWPVCGIANTYIHAVLELVRNHGLRPDDIVEIRPYIGDFQQRMSYPLEERRQPACSMDARFSLPFCLAAAATYGEVKIEHFTEAGLRDPKVLETAQKIVPINDSSLDWKGEMPNARVEIDTRSGETLAGSGDGTLGGKNHPMEWEHIIAKFVSCAALAPIPISPAKINEAVEMARSLETLSDGTELLRKLS
ncbi:MmgE/PrpD family protein [Sphingobium sp. EP60837]|uniref:MmgE/PrpD family protein n=1 Tax=Sphingobium sp. EP60837 TaxID=1855519 RepID=UPI0007DCEF82|nr:MmgE/PrpD family protein [Sphingobium sp. EP60837]ANI80131.1 2-methylcitrate dehydratase [Sphingobium sp. EP60837]